MALYPTPTVVVGTILQTSKLTVNIVDEDLLPRADYVGTVSGAKEDKSEVFAYRMGEAGAHVNEDSPLTMECRVEDNCRTEIFDNFICKIDYTYADERILSLKMSIFIRLE